MNYEQFQQEIQENLPIPSREELWEAIENSNLTKYTPRQIEQGMLQIDEYESTLYHLAAIKGQLDKIPKELLTKKNLTKIDINGGTALQNASYAGQLDLIPKEILTTKNLLETDSHFMNCLHYAAYGGHVNKIPRLSYETLKELKTHFERKNSSEYLEEMAYEAFLNLKAYWEGESSKYNDEILNLLNKQIGKFETIRNSLKQNHEPIL